METNEPKKRRGRPRKNLNVETINNVETKSNEQIGTLNNDIIDDIEEVSPIKESKKISKKVIKKEEVKEKNFFERLYNL